MGTPPVGLTGGDTMPSNNSDAPAASSVPMPPPPAAGLAPNPRNKLPPLAHGGAPSPALAASAVAAPGAIASPGAPALAPPATANPQEREILAAYTDALQR
jgi:hypothetical protein